MNWPTNVTGGGYLRAWSVGLGIRLPDRPVHRSRRAVQVPVRKGQVANQAGVELIGPVDDVIEELRRYRRCLTYQVADVMKNAGSVCRSRQHRRHHRIETPLHHGLVRQRVEAAMLHKAGHRHADYGSFLISLALPDGSCSCVPKFGSAPENASIPVPPAVHSTLIPPPCSCGYTSYRQINYCTSSF